MDNPDDHIKKMLQEGFSHKPVQNIVDLVDEKRALAVESIRDIPASSLQPVIRPNGEKYYPRKLGNYTDVETLRLLREAGVFVLLEGYPGTGKTSLIEASFGEELLTVGTNGDLRIEDLIGSYMPDPDQPSEPRWVEGILPQAMREGKVLFIDDITMIDPGVLVRLHPLMDGRKTIEITEHGREIVEAHENFYIVAAHNPGEIGAHLTSALASRFGWKKRIGTDLNLASKLGVPQKIIDWAKDLRVRHDNQDIMWSPQMRELLDFVRVKKALGLQSALTNLVMSAPLHERERLRAEMMERFQGQIMEWEESELRGE